MPSFSGDAVKGRQMSPTPMLLFLVNYNDPTRQA